MDEWSEAKNIRAWSDIVSVVDRAFWSDVRWINYQENQWKFLNNTLEMEWSLYQSITNLEQDILWIFGQENNKMSNIIELIGYKKYFASPGALKWSVLWKEVLLQYPKKPESGNIEDLLSLSSLSPFSCHKQDLSSYFQLVESWGFSNYKISTIDFCLEKTGMRIDDMSQAESEDALNMLDGVTELNKGADRIHILNDIENLESETLKELVIDLKKTATTITENLRFYMTEAENNIEALRVNTGNMEEEIDALKINQEKAKNDIIHLTSSLEQAVSDLEKLMDSRNDINDLRERNQNLKTDIAGLTATLKQAVSDITKQTAQMQNTQTDIHNLRTTLNQAQTHITQMQADIKQAQTDTQNLEDLHLTYTELESLLKNRQSGSEDLQIVAGLLSVYETEKYARDLNEWKHLINYFSEEEWLSITHALRTSHDRNGIKKVLDMHHHVHEGRIPFLGKDILAVLMSKEESVLDMADKYGYGRNYINDPYTLHLFWNEIEKKVSLRTEEKTDLRKRKSTDQCSYSHVSNVFRFFSSANKKNLLLNQFNFENCINFMEEFKIKEWSKLAKSIHQSENGEKIENLLPETETKQIFVWWMARVLSLYPSSLESVDSPAKEAVAKISASEWKSIITVLLESLTEKSEFKPNVSLFQATVDKVKSVYARSIQLSLCHFFGQENSPALIQDYDSHLIMSLLSQIDRSPTVIYNQKRVRKNICFDLIPRQKINTILFAWAYSFFKSFEHPVNEHISEGESSTQTTEGRYFDEYVTQIRNQARQIMNVFMKVRSWDKNKKAWTDYLWIRDFDFLIRDIYGNKMYLKHIIPDYISKTGYMDDEYLPFYFSFLVFQKLQSAADKKEDTKDIITYYMKKETELSLFDEIHGKWLLILLRVTHHEMYMREPWRRKQKEHWDTQYKQTIQQFLHDINSQWDFFLTHTLNDKMHQK